MPPALHDAYRRVLKEAEKIWCERQGQHHLTPFPEKPEVILSEIRLGLWRLEMGTEKWEDTALDLINWSAIYLMVARGEWKE